MSEGMSHDIHTIRNIAIFFLVLCVVSIVLSMGTIGYTIYKAKTAGDEA